MSLASNIIKCFLTVNLANIPVPCRLSRWDQWSTSMNKLARWPLDHSGPTCNNFLCILAALPSQRVGYEVVMWLDLMPIS